MVFSSFTSRMVDLLYFNITNKLKCEDLYLLHLSKIFHNVLDSSIERQSFVFTNYISMGRRFVNI
jgi:hypothetical protein